MTLHSRLYWGNIRQSLLNRQPETRNINHTKCSHQPAKLGKTCPTKNHDNHHYGTLATPTSFMYLILGEEILLLLFGIIVNL